MCRTQKLRRFGSVRVQTFVRASSVAKPFGRSAKSKLSRPHFSLQDFCTQPAVPRRDFPTDWTKWVALFTPSDPNARTAFVFPKVPSVKFAMGELRWLGLGRCDLQRTLPFHDYYEPIISVCLPYVWILHDYHLMLLQGPVFCLQTISWPQTCLQFFQLLWQIL